MSDTVFRTPVSETVKETGTIPKGDGKVTLIEDGNKVEVPFLDYEATYHKPLPVDFFKLMKWEDPEGGFKDEVKTIDNYLKKLVNSGNMDNSVENAKEKLKTIEKMVGADKTERTVVKIAKIAAYIKFLESCQEIEGNAKKYAN